MREEVRRVGRELAEPVADEGREREAHEDLLARLA